jgi:hypothetical protein
MEKPSSILATLEVATLGTSSRTKGSSKKETWTFSTLDDTYKM